MCVLHSGARREGRVGLALPILTFLRARLRPTCAPLSGTRRGGRPASRAPSPRRPSDAAQGLAASLACAVSYRRGVASCVRACAGTAGRPLPAWRAPAARPGDIVCRLRAGRWRCGSTRTRLGRFRVCLHTYIYPPLPSHLPSACRALALRLHPDKAAVSGPGAAAASALLFRAVSRAHACLSDPAQRRMCAPLAAVARR